MELKKVIKDWMLPIAMTTGASLYLIYNALPAGFHRAGPVLEGIVEFLQPLLLFAMLFITFCRIEPRELKPHRWHWWLLLIQGGLFVLLGFAALAVIRLFPCDSHRAVVLIESAMLCLICPTASAAAVVTRKLGGDVAGITTYTVLINILAATLVPLIVPLIHPMEGMSFGVAFSMILAKVFPLLIMPCLAAWLVRYLFPKFHRWLLRFPDLAFYIWAVALTLAIAISVRYLLASTLSLRMIGMMALVSLLCCIFQFAAGRFVGRRYRPRLYYSTRKVTLDDSYKGESGGFLLISDEKTGRSVSEEVVERGKAVREVTAGQALGQKNTIFSIWMAYTFMTPETAIIGGLYSIWHNAFNSWQLYRAGRS